MSEQTAKTWDTMDAGERVAEVREMLSRFDGINDLTVAFSDIVPLYGTDVAGVVRLLLTELAAKDAEIARLRGEWWGVWMKKSNDMDAPHDGGWVCDNADPCVVLAGEEDWAVTFAGELGGDYEARPLAGRAE